MSEQVTQLEQQIEDVKYLNLQAEKAIRLVKNKDFRELILEGFCRDDVARLCAVAGDPGTSQVDRDVATDMSRAGGHLKRFINVIITQANTAQRDLPNMGQALAEARAMDAVDESGGFTSMGGEFVRDDEPEAGVN